MAPRFPKISDITNKTRKIIKNIFAIPADAPAMPVKPSIAANIAITKKLIARFSKTNTP